MTVRNVTATWRAEAGTRGVYIVRSTKPGSEDKLRIGAGGNHGGKGGLKGRLLKHGQSPPKVATFGTHDHQPYKHVVAAWALDGWSASEVNDAEHLAYRPFLVRFPRADGCRPDTSIFLVPPDANLESLVAEIQTDLLSLDALRTVV